MHPCGQPRPRRISDDTGNRRHFYDTSIRYPINSPRNSPSICCRESYKIPAGILTTECNNANTLE